MHLLIADDHPLFREALRQLLPQLSPEATAEQARDLAEFESALARPTDLDLAIVDLGLLDPEAERRIAALRERRPEVPLVIVSANEQPADIRRCLDAGASGYLPKSASAKLIVAALRFVLETGGVYLPPQLLAAPERAPNAPEGAAGLTERQREILALLGEGHSNRSIADRLAITEGTVKIHVAAILKALGVTRRTEAAVIAARGRSRS